MSLGSMQSETDEAPERVKRFSESTLTSVQVPVVV